LFVIEMELAAAAGNAPALPVSETGVLTSTLNGKAGLACRAAARNVTDARQALLDCKLFLTD
jgi:hypothetical protein